MIDNVTNWDIHSFRYFYKESEIFFWEDLTIRDFLEVFMNEKILFPREKWIFLGKMLP